MRMTQRPDNDVTATPASRGEDPLGMRDLDQMYQLYGELRSCPVSHSEAQGGFY